MPRSLKIARALPAGDAPGPRDGWAERMIGLADAWRELDLALPAASAKSPAEPIAVAIVDWGVQSDHEAFASTPGLLLPGRRVIPPEDGDFGDDDGHGTMLAGTIAGIVADPNGARMPAVRLLPVKFVDVSTPPMSEYAAAGIDFAVAAGAKVINASWDVGYDSRELRRAIERAAAKNVLVVAAAGNGGGNNAEYPTFPASLALPNMISVMAADRHDQKPFFSNYGGNVDLAAPGVDIVSASPYLLRSPEVAYRSYSGTSAAAAFVSGAAALLLTINSDWPPQTIREILMDSVDPDPGLRALCRAGGRLNLRRAVELARRRLG
jgi:subtilisin family serine protease